jgi:hypothetical protein
MSFQLSPQMKIVALAGMFAILALGGGMMFMGRSQPESLAEPTLLPHVKPAVAKTPLPSKHVPAKKAAHAKKAPAVAKKPVVAKPKPKPKPVSPVAANGLPTPLAYQLSLHDVVVVSLFNPQSSTDSIAFQEARAGAGMADVGFFPVSVLNQRVVGPLTAKLGHILPAPGLLVYRSPDLLVLQLDGFADRQTVAQAADNAVAVR